MDFDFVTEWCARVDHGRGDFHLELICYLPCFEGFGFFL